MFASNGAAVGVMYSLVTLESLKMFINVSSKCTHGVLVVLNNTSVNNKTHCTKELKELERMAKVLHKRQENKLYIKWVHNMPLKASIHILWVQKESFVISTMHVIIALW